MAERISVLWRLAAGLEDGRGAGVMPVQETVERIYEAERENIYSYLRCLGVPSQRAQELVQDSFVRLFVKMAKGETIENPRAWLYRVAHNFALRSWTREPQFEELPRGFEFAGQSADPERVLLEAERRRALLRAMRELSPQQKHCLDLRVRGLRYREIAEVIGISTSAVSEFLRRAVVRLKEALDA